MMKPESSVSFIIRNTRELDTSYLPSLLEQFTSRGLYPLFREGGKLKAAGTNKGITKLLKSNYRDDYPANHHLSWSLGLGISYGTNPYFMFVDVNQNASGTCEISGIVNLSGDIDKRNSDVWCVRDLVRDLFLHIRADSGFLDYEDFIDEIEKTPNPHPLAWYTVVNRNKLNSSWIAVVLKAPVWCVRENAAGVVEIQLTERLVVESGSTSKFKQLTEHFREASLDVRLGGRAKQ